MSVELSGRRRRSRPIAQINVVPYIDVMLVLLIIFMVTAPMLTPSTVDLPSVGNARQQPDQVVQIIVRKDEDLQLIDATGQRQSVALDDVAGKVQALQANASHPAVVIAADRHVDYASVVAVMDKLQRAGVARVGLSVVLAK